MSETPNRWSTIVFHNTSITLEEPPPKRHCFHMTSNPYNPDFFNIQQQQQQQQQQKQQQQQQQQKQQSKVNECFVKVNQLADDLKFNSVYEINDTTTEIQQQQQQQQQQHHHHHQTYNLLKNLDIPNDLIEQIKSGSDTISNQDIDVEEFNCMRLPDEIISEKQRVLLPKYVTSRKLSASELKLWKIIEYHLKDKITILNPFTTARQSNKTISIASINTNLRYIENIFKFMNFPDMSLIDLWWNLTRPATIKKVILILRSFQQSGQTWRHYIEAHYRLCWLYNFLDFRLAINWHPQPKFLSQLIVLFSKFFGEWTRFGISFGKKSTLKRRTKEELCAKKKWVAAETILDTSNRIGEAIINSPNDFSFNELRDTMVFCFFTLGPTVRTQNIQLLVLDHDENISDTRQTQIKVKQYNDNLMKRAHTNKSYIAQKLTGAIFRQQIDEAYKVIWVDYKTWSAFGDIVRMYSHPIVVSLIELYLNIRNEKNNIFIQYDNGQPSYHASVHFMNISKKYLGSKTDISTTRSIFTTKMKNCATHTQYLDYCALLLHSETVSNLNYYKTNDLDQKEYFASLQSILGDDRGTKMEECLSLVRKFIVSHDSDGLSLVENIETVKNFINLATEEKNKKINELKESLPIPEPVKSKSPLANYFDGKTYNCSCCNRTFSKGSNLSRHLSNCHPAFIPYQMKKK